MQVYLCILEVINSKRKKGNEIWRQRPFLIFLSPRAYNNYTWTYFQVPLPLCCSLLDSGREATDITKMCRFKTCSCTFKPLDLCITLLKEVPRKDFPMWHLVSVSSSALRPDRVLLLNGKRVDFLFSSLQGVSFVRK